MTTLTDHQFELLANDGDEDGIVFGIRAATGIDMVDGGFLPGDDDYTTDDNEDPINGGTRFGRDRLTGPTHGFSLFTNLDDEGLAIDALGEFKTAWRNLSMRNRPGALCAIRYSINDRVRRFYGRTRRFAAPPSNLSLGGMIPITTDFAAVDGYFYDDEVQTISVESRSTTGGSLGGFIFPTTFPTTTLPNGMMAGQAVVGGDAPAYPIIRFEGPSTNPRLETPAWTLRLTGSIADGDFVEIDTRPWARTILLNGQASVAAMLSATKRQYIADMVLQPGNTDLAYWASGDSGSSACTVRWRNTFNSY